MTTLNSQTYELELFATGFESRSLPPRVSDVRPLEREKMPEVLLLLLAFWDGCALGTVALVEEPPPPLLFEPLVATAGGAGEADLLLATLQYSVYKIRHNLSYVSISREQTANWKRQELWSLRRSWRTAATAAGDADSASRGAAAFVRSFCRALWPPQNSWCDVLARFRTELQ